jgi:hypothetical protein
MDCWSLIPSDALLQEIDPEYHLGALTLDPSSGHPAPLLAVLQCCPVSGDLEEPAVRSADIYREPCNFTGCIMLSTQYVAHVVGKKSTYKTNGEVVYREHTQIQ